MRIGSGSDEKQIWWYIQWKGLIVVMSEMVAVTKVGMLIRMRRTFRIKGKNNHNITVSYQ